MNKGDLFNVYLDGVMMTICVIGSYKEEHSGEEVVVLALISPDNMLHIPLSDLNVFFPAKKNLN
ncbi:MAG: hypothetical protein ACM3UZ_11745 [Acidobacteriota bacterium]